MNATLCRNNLLLAFMLLAPLFASAQESDSAWIYGKIEKASYKHKLTRLLYKSIFKTPKPGGDSLHITGTKNKMVNPFIPYRGKVIRHISIAVFDPFGYSVNDTLHTPGTWLEQAGNRYHITTHQRVINNLLLFKPGKPLDPLALSESERLLRQTPYINDARIYVKKVRGDSVDVTVLVHDKWSLGVASNLDPGRPDLSILERNLAGSGQQFEQKAEVNPNTGELRLEGQHHINNIRRTYITSSLYYSTSFDIQQIGFGLDRAFFSPLARWAGGVDVHRTWTYFTPPDTTVPGQLSRYGMDYNQQDIWLGHSIRLGKGKSFFTRSCNLVFSARYFNIGYTKRPGPGVDVQAAIRNYSLYLVSAGLSIRQYYKERYIYRFGANEDVPEGLLLQATSGIYQREMEPQRYYAGLQAARGLHFDDVGYFSGGIGYGTFFNKNSVHDGTINADLFYFSNLMQVKRWYIREFISWNMVYGLHKAPYQLIDINGSAMNGFSSNMLTGSRKMVLNLQTVLYAPYNVLGFKFAPVLQAAFGAIGNEDKVLLRGRIYQAYAIGVLIRNENLLFNTIRLTVGYYPYVPGNGDDVLKLNPAGNYSLRLRDFAASKPELVAFE